MSASGREPHAPPTADVVESQRRTSFRESIDSSLLEVATSPSPALPSVRPFESEDDTLRRRKQHSALAAVSKSLDCALTVLADYWRADHLEDLQRDAGHKYLEQAQEKDGTRARRRRTWRERLVISPTSRPKLAFDMIVLSSILYTAISIPVKMSLRVHFAEALEVCVDVLFIADVVLQFFHGYVSAGYPVTDPRRITRRYLRGWFAIDLVSCLPLDLIFSDARGFTLLKTIRMLRARKLLQVSGHLRSSNMLRVVLTLATWLLLAHWAACLFYGLGFYTVCVFEWYTNSWVLFYWQGIVSRTTFCEGNGYIVWTREAFLANHSRADDLLGVMESELVHDRTTDLEDELGVGAAIGIATGYGVGASTRYVRALFWALATEKQQQAGAPSAEGESAGSVDGVDVARV